MGRLVLHRDIAAPASEVFKAFTDPALNADWMDAQRVQDVRGALDLAGSTYTLVIFGPWRFKSSVVRSVPPSVHETHHDGLFGAMAHMTAVLTEQEGRTHLELTTEWTVPFGPIGRWMDRRWFENGPHTQANKEIDRLVTIVSAPA